MSPGPTRPPPPPQTLDPVELETEMLIRKFEEKEKELKKLAEDRAKKEAARERKKAEEARKIEEAMKKGPVRAGADRLLTREELLKAIYDPKDPKFKFPATGSDSEEDEEDADGLEDYSGRAGQWGGKGGNMGKLGEDDRPSKEEIKNWFKGQSGEVIF